MVIHIWHWCVRNWHWCVCEEEEEEEEEEPPLLRHHLHATVKLPKTQMCGEDTSNASSSRPNILHVVSLVRNCSSYVTTHPLPHTCRYDVIFHLGGYRQNLVFNLSGLTYSIVVYETSVACVITPCNTIFL